MSISFDKHKSFQNKTQVTLAPLTLIFGHNSSGKSTAIEKLNRVKLMQFFEDIEKDRSSLKIPLNASFVILQSRLHGR
jgi:predicted ATPase